MSARITRAPARSSVLRRCLPALAAVVLGLAVAGPSAPAAASEVDTYLNLPLVNRDAAHGPGGVNPALPTDRGVLARLLDQARASGAAPTSYAALLDQYWLADVTAEAGIDLAGWDPRTGVQANRENLIRSYRYYEHLQLSHPELQWAGMAGQVGADFGGGLIDFELITDVYDLPQLQQTTRAIVATATEVAGPQIVDRLPKGLRALAGAGATVTGDDLHYILGMILVMQKNIFSDLMPMHRAYVTGGLPALGEMRAAGLFGQDVMDAWRDIASADPDRIARGNVALLRREQGVIIRDQWDAVRAYKGDVGEAITYLSTVAGSPSVAGVLPPRSFDPIEIEATLPDGRTVTLTTPLPSWNWSVYEQRWDYITTQLLPRYKATVEYDWPRLEAELRTPYGIQIESHRPLMNVPQILQSALQNTKVTVS
ncbi:hypothetical protein [Rhodococcus maanshanensis]|uniref:Uncharacterized protein n=1 Tax=Rhodococcus maanshanensis TaxID=183556 RepID=A0A1H7MVF5_9NOCA|nr:hypothetical protein [Rhodococcus maanshanensis]SEL15272.1 hypothetical protein SAMN05444583_106163 [Rhodococcus maanshanensis]